MIYPDDYKCLICKYRYYACIYRNNKRMLSCSRFEFQARKHYKGVNVALARCFFGVCPRIIASKLY